MEEEVLRKIHVAFPDGRPPDRPVTGHRCDECDDVDHLLGGRVWWDVANDFPNYCHDTYPLLTLPAKVYYLPAYMSCAVRSLGTMAGDSVFTYLEHGALPRDVFTPAQRAAILQWVEWYCRDDPEGRPPEHVAAYWRSDEG